MFKRGNIATDIQNGVSVMVLGPEDFDGYDQNRPSDKWELVQYPNGLRVWAGVRWLTKQYDVLLVNGKEYKHIG